MNILAQICGLVIVILLLILYKSQKTLKLFNEKMFLMVVTVTGLNLLLDINSIIFIHYADVVGEFWVHFFCKLYLTTFLVSGFATVFYVLTGVIPEKKRIKLLKLSSIALLVEAIVIFVLPIDVFEDGMVVYSLGPSVVATYFLTIVYLLATIGIAIFNVMKFNKRRAAAILMWMGVWAICAIIQFAFNQFLLVGFASSIGMLILYIMIETPEGNLDKQYGCFNPFAFNTFVIDRNAFDINYAVLEIRVSSRSLMNQPFFDQINTPRKIIKFIHKTPGTFVFKNIDISLYAVAQDVESLVTIYNKIFELASEYRVEKFITFTIIPNAVGFKNSEEIQNLFNFARNKGDVNDGILKYADDSTLQSFKEESIMVDEIKCAIVEDRIVPFLQPIFSIENECFECAEALCRIIDADGRVIPPGKFIPVAEKYNLIDEIGERVFEKVCDFIDKNSLSLDGVRYYEVNLSVIQCEKEHLADKFVGIIKKYGVAPNKINFEITETGLIKSRPTVIDNMNDLISFGCSFSLDDFGKGESNIDYLIDMPVSLLKLDMDLIKAYKKSSKAKAAIKGVIDMAHNIGLRVVAEGIETEIERDVFKELGVDLIQGFYYCKPIPLSQFTDFIIASNITKVKH